MKVLTPSGATLDFDSQFPTPLWTAGFRLVGDGGASLRAFQVTPIAAIRAMVSDLAGTRVSHLSAGGGTLSTYDVGGPKRDPEQRPDAIDLSNPAASSLAPGVLGVWSGKTHGVFSFFYGSTANAAGVTTYYTNLRFTENNGVRVESLVPRESMVSERVCIPVDHVGLFTVSDAGKSRSLVPRAPGRRIGATEVWRQVYEPQPGQREVVYVAATRTAVALFAPEWADGHRPSDDENDRRAFRAIEQVARLEWA